jgi:3-deoxy-D-manno-octulosonic-acid transferase
MGRNFPLFRAAYGTAWRLAPALLRRNARLRDGWDLRMGREPLPRADLWMQAASGGEAFLGVEIAKRLPNVSILATTNTRQGYDILAGNGPAGLTPAFCPFDAPSIMRRAFARIRPRLLVLLETELWPGMLLAARQADIPVVILNGRLNRSSLAGYLAWPSFWRTVAPAEVRAVSQADADRYDVLFGRGVARTMPNIKFDRLAPAGGGDNSLSALFPDQAPVVVLGSIREPEEPLVAEMISHILSRRPDAVVALYPRHMERIDAWAERLRTMSVPVVRRSQASRTRPGDVVLGDVFGELGRAYGVARAVFVGGSLLPLGGQNFLEPLLAGVRPVIGPHWSNFAWVGREAVEAGLVLEVPNAREAATILARELANPMERDEVVRRTEEYVATRRGGAAQAAQVIARRLEMA